MARRRFVSRGRTIDFKQWSSIPGISADAAAIGIIGASSLAFAEPVTVLRIRGGGVACLDGAVDGDTNNIAVAIGVVSTDAAAAGTGSLPDPIQEPEYDWLYWEEFSLKNALAIAAEASSDIFHSVRFRFDTKAMRKIKPGSSLIMVVQTGTAVPIDVELDQARVLIGT